jgi:hypothetical protein
MVGRKNFVLTCQTRLGGGRGAARQGNRAAASEFLFLMAACGLSAIADTERVRSYGPDRKLDPILETVWAGLGPFGIRPP